MLLKLPNGVCFIEETDFERILLQICSSYVNKTWKQSTLLISMLSSKIILILFLNYYPSRINVLRIQFVIDVKNDNILGMYIIQSAYRGKLNKHVHLPKSIAGHAISLNIFLKEKERKKFRICNFHE